MKITVIKTKEALKYCKYCAANVRWRSSDTGIGTPFRSPFVEFIINDESYIWFNTIYDLQKLIQADTHESSSDSLCESRIHETVNSHSRRIDG